MVAKDGIFRKCATVFKSECVKEVDGILVHRDVGELICRKYLQRLEVQESACACTVGELGNSDRCCCSGSHGVVHGSGSDLVEGTKFQRCIQAIGGATLHKLKRGVPIG